MRSPCYSIGAGRALPRARFWSPAGVTESRSGSLGAAAKARTNFPEAPGSLSWRTASLHHISRSWHSRGEGHSDDCALSPLGPEAGLSGGARPSGYYQPPDHDAIQEIRLTGAHRGDPAGRGRQVDPDCPTGPRRRGVPRTLRVTSCRRSLLPGLSQAETAWMPLRMRGSRVYHQSFGMQTCDAAGPFPPA
mgnify:CR=1 FL=1